MTTTAYPTMMGIPPARSKRETMRSLLDRYQSERGLTRLLVINQMRDYVRTHDHRSLLEEIYAVTDDRDIKVLIGVGMRGELYTAVVGQQARLKGLI